MSQTPSICLRHHFSQKAGNARSVGVTYNCVSSSSLYCEPVWPSGKAGTRSGGASHGSIPLRLSFLFKSCGLWTLSCDFVPHN